MKISPEDIRTQLNVLHTIRQAEATLNAEEDIRVEVVRLKLDLLDRIDYGAESTAIEVLKVAPAPTHATKEDSILF